MTPAAWNAQQKARAKKLENLATAAYALGLKPADLNDPGIRARLEATAGTSKVMEYTWEALGRRMRRAETDAPDPFAGLA